MKRIYLLSFALVALFVSSANTQQRQLTQDDAKSERRVALVLGNSAYEISPLKNPVNDARDMAQALRELGFEVIYRENLNQHDMKRAIRDFGAKLRTASIGLFYYAGHGMQVKGVNYLVPVDAKVESEEEVEYECVEAGFVLAQMESAGNRMNVVILDACRNNPFASSLRSPSRGLALMSAPSGTLIAYATAPGSVASDGGGRNGLYTRELLKFVRTPGLEIENVFKQVRISVRNLTQGKQTPWESSSLVGDFFFTPAYKKTTSLGTSSQPQLIIGTWRNSRDYNPSKDEFPCVRIFFPGGTAALKCGGVVWTTYKYVFDGATLEEELVNINDQFYSQLQEKNKDKDIPAFRVGRNIGSRSTYNVKIEGDNMTWTREGHYIEWIREQ